MMNIIKKVLAAVIMVALLLPTAQNAVAAGTTSSLLKGKKADTVFSILNGRLSIKMPKGAVEEEVNYGGIMGTTADTSGETWISLSANEQEFGVLAQELFYYSAGNLLDDAKLFLKQFVGKEAANFTVSDIRKASNLEYVVITPKQISTPSPTSFSLLKSALIKAADNTLIHLSVYADWGALAYQKDCVSMADSIIKSLQSGKRLLDKNPRTVEMYKCSMNLEKGYVYIVEAGADYEVYRFKKLVTIGKEQPYFGIYSGGHPFKPRTQTSPTKKEGTVFGKSIKWDVYASEKDKIDKNTSTETIVKYKGGYLHIFAYPKNPSDWKVIEKMVHSLKEV